MELGQTDQSLSESAKTNRFPGERLEGWVGSVGVKTGEAGSFQFPSSEVYVPSVRSLACAPRKETCSPLARQPTTHSFTLPRVRQPFRPHRWEARPEATGKRLHLCTRAHFGLSNYLSKVASLLTDVCISTATSRCPASRCPHSD